jgi:hypothetical protein
MNFEQLDIFYPYNIALRKGRQALFAFDMEAAKVHFAKAESFSKNPAISDFFRAIDFFENNLKLIQKIDNIKQKVNRYRKLWGEFESNLSMDSTLQTDLKKHYFKHIVSELGQYNIVTLNVEDIYEIYWEAGCYQELYQTLLLMIKEKPEESQLALMAANTSHVLGYRPESWIFYGKYCLLVDQFIDKGQILDQDWRDLLVESSDEGLPPAWIWIKAQLKGLFPLAPENYANAMFLKKDFEQLREEYQLNPSDDKIASQLWFKTLQKAESSGNVVEQRIFLKQINPAMFKMYMKKKGHSKL